MRLLVVTSLLTLDGVMEAPNGPRDNPETGFHQGGWAAPFQDADMARISSAGVGGTGALLLGRVTYLEFARAWPNMPPDNAMARHLNSIPKYVWSRTLDKAEWNNSTILRGDLSEEVTKLKQQPGEGGIAVTGSGQLARALMARDLVDRYVFMICPIVLGSGKRLFVEGMSPLRLKLIDSQTTGSGVVVLTYEPTRG